MPGCKLPVGQRIDAVIERVVPDVQKAVTWNSPCYGRERACWLLSLPVCARHVQVAFFRGTLLDPLPPKPSRHPGVRSVDIHEGADFEAQPADRVRQASALPGEKP